MSGKPKTMKAQGVALMGVSISLNDERKKVLYKDLEVNYNTTDTSDLIIVVMTCSREAAFFRLTYKRNSVQYPTVSRQCFLEFSFYYIDCHKGKKA